MKTVNRKKARITATGKRGFLIWLARDMPDVYRAIKSNRPDLLDVDNDRIFYRSARQWGRDSLTGYNYDTGNFDLHGMGQAQPTVKADDEGSWWQNAIRDGIKYGGEFFTERMKYQQQKKLIDENIRRSQMGLPPLSTGDVAPTLNIEAGDELKSTLLKMGLPLAMGLTALIVVPKILGR